MKKIIFLLMLFASTIAFKTEAQTNFRGTTYKPGTTTTVGTLVTIEVPVLDATIDTFNLTMDGAYNAVMTVQWRLLKSTGTIAGTTRLYGSDYGTTNTWNAVGDTATNTNVAVNSHTWTVTQPAYKFYRLLSDGGTTMTGTASARAFGIKPQ